MKNIPPAKFKLKPEIATLILKAARLIVEERTPCDGYMLVCGFDKILRFYDIPSLTQKEIQEIKEVSIALSVTRSFRRPNNHDLLDLDWVVMSLFGEEPMNNDERGNQ